MVTIINYQNLTNDKPEEDIQSEACGKNETEGGFFFFNFLQPFAFYLIIQIL